MFSVQKYPLQRNKQNNRCSRPQTGRTCEFDATYPISYKSCIAELIGITSLVKAESIHNVNNRSWAQYYTHLARTLANRLLYIVNHINHKHVTNYKSIGKVWPVNSQSRVMKAIGVWRAARPSAEHVEQTVRSLGVDGAIESWFLASLIDFEGNTVTRFPASSAGRRHRISNVLHTHQIIARGTGVRSIHSTHPVASILHDPKLCRGMLSMTRTMGVQYEWRFSLSLGWIFACWGCAAATCSCAPTVRTIV